MPDGFLERSPGATSTRRSLFHRLGDGVRFRFELWLVRGVGARLLLAAAIIATVALLGGALALEFTDGFSALDESIWWAFLRLTDPGYLGDDEGVAQRTISTVVTVLGYVLFLGLLVAILTQWLNETLQRLESGVTPVALSHHVLILGLTHRTPRIVQELLRTSGRTQRFLERHGARALHIVVLAEVVDRNRLQALRENVGPLWNDRQVVVRQGSPLRLDHLERVAFRDAAAVILPGADFTERRPETVDAQTIKTLLSVSRYAAAAGAVPPVAVAALYDEARSPVARRAYAGECEIVAADDLVSRLMAQSIRHPGLWRVLRELLTRPEGNALYVRPTGKDAGAAFGELAPRFSRAIPIGILRPGAQRPSLAPHPDTRLEADDLLVLVARRFQECTTDPRADRPGETPASAPAPARPTTRLERVLVLGWSRKVPALLRELDAGGLAPSEIVVVSSVPLEQREASLAQHGVDRARQRVQQIQESYSAPGGIERLDPARYDLIALIASERLDDTEEADATTVFAFQALRHLLPETGGARLLVEILDDANRFLFPADGEDVLVSPMVISYVLSQVALRPELGGVFSELVASTGAQIVLQPASDYGVDGRAVRFDEIAAATRARGDIALGLRLRSEGDAGVRLNPPRDTAWQLAADDEVVVLASDMDSP